MSMTPSTSTIAEFDPLRERHPSNAAPTSTDVITSPLSFKRRKPSGTFKGSLLGGILLSKSNDEDKLPSFERGASDESDGEDVEEEGDTSNVFGSGAGRTERGAWAPSGRGNRIPSRGQRSFLQRKSSSLLVSADDGEVTPLPILPMIVLCICMFSEFLSASTAAPFLFFMVSDFSKDRDEAEIAFWAAVVGSTFFLAQFLTSLLWVSIAEKHGRRAVLFSSLAGNGISLMLFGTSRNIRTAICLRLGQGLFSGSIGVARGGVRDITDRTNEGHAFTLISMSWGVGGIVGSIIGGLTEHPVQNLSYFFADSTLFAKYPYLLPCMISGSVTLLGSILSLFLNRDGGLRSGGIKLPSAAEKDLESAYSFPRRFLHRITGCVSRRQSRQEMAAHAQQERDQIPTPSETMDIRRDERNPLSLNRFATKQSGYGSASGYNNSLAPHTPRGSAYGFGGRGGGGGGGSGRGRGRGGMRSVSAATSTRYAPDYDDLDHQDLNFAQRLLLANEGAVFSLSDLWVAAATQNEQEDVDDYVEEEAGGESVFEDDESRVGFGDDEPDFFGFGTAPPSLEDIRATAGLQSIDRLRGYSSLALPFDLASNRRYARGPRSRIVSDASYGRSMPYRRTSIASSARGPAIFANTGLQHASLASSATATMLSPKAVDIESPFEAMGAIPEQRSTPGLSIVNAAITDTAGSEAQLLQEEEEVTSPASLIGQLPLALIAQYALLALHCTATDQVFMLFLVTPVPSGGLGLQAANYAMLVSLMFVFSLIWQFQFYPNVSAPRGRLSHLSMFRLGLSLYLPVYLLFPELRGLLKESGNGWVFVGLALLSSVRYLANTCSYTSLIILINATTPPHLIPLSNGLAQSAVSLSRFAGPLIGGTLWAASITGAHDYPFNYALGFIVAAALCFLGLLHSTRIR